MRQMKYHFLSNVSTDWKLVLRLYYREEDYFCLPNTRDSNSVPNVNDVIHLLNWINEQIYDNVDLFLALYKLFNYDICFFIFCI